MMMKAPSRGGLLLAVSVLCLLPCSSCAFQFSNKNPSQPQQVSSSSQASTLKGTNSKTFPVVKAAVGLLTGGVNNLVRTYMCVRDFVCVGIWYVVCRSTAFFSTYAY